MLYIIGLGLGDEKDVSVRGLECIRKSEEVYLEMYTSILCSVNLCEGTEDLEQEACFQKSIHKMEELYGKKILLANRVMVEDADEGRISYDIGKPLPLRKARELDVSILVIGDPLSATTHNDLVLKCIDLGIPYTVVHNTSIMTAVGITGISMYNFGVTVSIPFFTDQWRPLSFCEKTILNKTNGHHTLCLLDIQVKEPSMEDQMLFRYPRKWRQPRFMTIGQAIDQLLEAADSLNSKEIHENTMGVGIARLGSENQKIIYGPLCKLRTCTFGPPLHSLIILSEPSIHDIEQKILNTYSIGYKVI